jgi:hypothetical protein
MGGGSRAAPRRLDVRNAPLLPPLWSAVLFFVFSIVAQALFVFLII